MVSSKNLILTFALCGIAQVASAQNDGLTKQFSTCMDNAGGVTINMLECLDAETKLQDKRLNIAYREAMGQLSPERKKQLQQAQRAWINYRDANCNFYADPEGGSMARLSASDCLMSETASRAKELETISGGSSAQAAGAAPAAPAAPAVSAAPAKPAAPAASASSPQNAPQALTGPQKNAVKAAKSYLSFSAFSRNGLIEQLSSPAGNNFEKRDATIAVDSLNVDWNEQAVKSAKQYLQLMGFSCKGLIQQLSSPAGGKFTEQQATFGAREAGAC